MKKILWVVNMPLPEATELFGLPYHPYGGWLINLAKNISSCDEIELHIAFPSPGKSTTQKGESIIYHKIETNRFINKNKDINEWKKLLESEDFEIVNIFGTEYSHTRKVAQICKNMGLPSIITLQGMPSFIAKHFRANLPSYVYYGFSLRNFILGDSVYLTKKKFEKNGKLEKEAIELSNNVMGRTTWDKACTEYLVDSAKYYHCEETLRESFYHGKWDIDLVEKHSIFLSQGQYSIKGFHLFLDVLPKIIARYPDTKVYVSGENILEYSSKKKSLLRHYYHSYIRKKIKKLGLTNSVQFLGPLNEEEMKKRYLMSHIFICPSTIENSPNSVFEALRLGVPVISSYVGGVPDMIEHKENGILYQSDANYLIPHFVDEIFSDNNFAMKLSNGAFQSQRCRKTASEISKRVIEIYESVIS